MRYLVAVIIAATIGCGRMPTDPASEPVAARPKPVTTAVCTLPPYGCKPDATSCYMLSNGHGGTDQSVCVYPPK